MRLWKLFGYVPRTTLWIAIVASVLAGFANVAIVALISQRLTSGDEFTAIFVLQFAAVALLVIGLDFGVKWLLLHMTAGTAYGLRVDLTKRILRSPLAVLEQLGPSWLIAALTDDVKVINLAFNLIPTTVMSGVVLVGCFAYLAWLSPPTLLLAAIMMLPAVLGQIWLRNRANRSRKAAVKIRTQLFSQYRMVIEGVKELKMHRGRRNAFLDDLIMPTASQYEAHILRSQSLHHLAMSWTQSIYFFFVLALFALANIWGLSQTILMTFALVALYARTSMNGLFAIVPYLNDAVIAADQLEQIGMILASDKVGATQPLADATPPVRVQLCGLQYCYQEQDREDSFDLGPIDLTMDSGELIFLIGGNGSGKTTLAKLLLGLYTPEQGGIEWNGQPVTSENVDDYRQLFSAVFADFFLFDQLLGLEDIANDDAANNYLKLLQLEHKVQASNGGLSTLDLSTGQRQRLALLTAYLENRPVYLFDEWAAGQDPDFKELFYRRLLPELRDLGKLVIVISHDDHYYDVANRIIKVDYGKIEYDRRV